MTVLLVKAEDNGENFEAECFTTAPSCGDPGYYKMFNFSKIIPASFQFQHYLTIWTFYLINN